MPSQFFILTVASAGSSLRPQFTFQLPTSFIELTSDCSKLIFEYDNTIIDITESLVAYKRNGRITHPFIHQWIINKRLNLTEQRKPAKLIFKFTIIRNTHRFILYTPQGNLLN